jgi:biopolymer transport protein ExbD
MAGSQDPNDNPVAINVVPMVDVIFCLCVFFMCCLKFTELEGRFRTWLPKDKGQEHGHELLPVEIRFALRWDPDTQSTEVRFGRVGRVVHGDEEIEQLIRGQKTDFERMGRSDVPVIVDSGPDVPWEQVLDLVNLAKREQVDKIEFAAGRRRA